MIRKVIIFIMFCLTVISSSCNSARKVVGHGENYPSVTDINKKCLEIQEKLVPRQYEGSDDSSIISILIDESVDTIPEWCFSRIPSLKEVIIRGNDVMVESNAFYACKNLQKVNLDNVIKCGESAFKMTSIDSISLKRCEYVEDFAFANCNSLCYVSFSDSLKQIGDFAFASDTTLVKIIVPNGIIGCCSFMGCSKLQDVKFGNVTVIGESAFLDCTSLFEITIPESVLEIKSEAFAGCTNLKVVRVTKKNTIIANNAFDKNTIIKYKN